VLIISILFGQLLGGYYIYNLLVEDNLGNENQQAQVQIHSGPVAKKKVLRLEPIKFYTIQLGIFPDVQSAQETINKLLNLGIRPFVSTGPPYKIWIGCFSEINSGRRLENSLAQQGFAAFIGEGLINDKALKFPGNNIYMQEKFAPLLNNYNIVLSHSLKMFKSPSFGEYKPEIWDEMIKKLQQEINIVVTETDEIFKLDTTVNYGENLSKLKNKIINYRNGLDKIRETRRDEAVLQSQGHLLELIAAYHNLIISTNEKLGTN